MNKWIHTVSVLLLTGALAACSDDDDGNAFIAPESTVGSLRVLHAVADAPAVNVSIGGSVPSALEGLDYKSAAGPLEAATGTVSVRVDGILPDGSTTTVIGPADVTVEEDVQTTVIAANKLASIEPLIINDPETDVADDTVRVQVVHASPDADAAAGGDVDVYVTAPSDDLSGAALGTFAYGGTLGPVEVPAGDYRIRIAPAGSSTVVFDTGADGVALPGGANLMVVAVDNTTTGDSPVSLVVLNDDESFELLDDGTPAGARVVHASPDAPAVEVFATSSALASSPAELIDAFDYTTVVPGTAGGYVDVPAGAYVFDVAPDTDTIGDSVFTSDSIELAAGMEYTVIAAGRLTTTPAFTLLATGDDNRAVSTEARVKVAHGAPAAGTVDVFVTPAGEYSTSEVENGMAGDPLLPGFEFGDITGYVPLTPGDYDIRVVAGGTAAINIEGYTLAAGTVATLIARGPAEPSGTPTDFNLIVLTN